MLEPCRAHAVERAAPGALLPPHSRQQAIDPIVQLVQLRNPFAGRKRMTGAVAIKK
ncbi:MAG: hypothetical protein FWD77_10485 [Betaproteobacteria bacterium]|nr:hypothetical protein [Betaproteobacteria bacterium]